MNRLKLQCVLAIGACFGSASLAAVAPPAATDAAKAQPGPAAQLIARARALDAQGRHDLAADNWRQVLLIEPKQPDALAALAAYAQSVGDTVHAAQYQQQLHTAGAAAAVAPSKPSGGEDARLQQAANLAAGHRYADALALYRQVFRGGPPAGPWAIAYYETEAAVPEEVAAAVAGLRSLIEKYPQEPTYRLSLGRVLTYRPATRLEGVRMLAGLRGSAAQNEQARAAWRQALLWEPAGPAALQTGPQYLERYPDSELAARLKTEHVRPAKIETPADSPLEGEGYKALGTGDLALAKEKFSALLPLPGMAGKGHAGLGYVAMQEQDFTAAVDNFEKAHVHGLQNAAMEKALVEARYFKAMTEGSQALKATDFDAAIAAFTRARQIDPQRPEAVEALAGSLVAGGQPAKAETLFAEAVKRNPENPDAWVEWFDALLGAGHAQQVLDEQANIPAQVNRKLEQRVDYLAILSSCDKALGDDATAQRLIDRLQEVSARGGAQSAGSQLRAAGLLLQQNDTDGAAQLCRSVIEIDHGNVDAWEMLVQIAHIAGDDVAAMSVAERMPEAVYKTAMKHPEFLLVLAAIDQARQQYEQAAKLLDRARTAGPDGLADSPRFQLQRASLELAQGNPERAYNIYRKVAAEYPDQLPAWSGMFAALHAGKHDQEALAAVARLPGDVSLRLQSDPAYLQVLASIYSEAGHPRQAIECLRAVSAIYRQRGQPAPFSVDSQFAWLLLNEGDQRQLAVTLDRLGSHRGLATDQKQELENIWAAWSMRRAEAEFSAGNGHKALSILQLANQAYPDDTVLRRELCSMYVRTGNPGPALRIYQDLDWEKAKIGDYANAVDAALVAHRATLADQWLQDGLQHFPDNDQLLALGARLEEQRGDVKRAKVYLLAEIDNGHAAANSAIAPVGADISRLDDDPGADPGAAALSPEKALAEVLGSASGTALRPGKNGVSRSPQPEPLSAAPPRKPQGETPDPYLPPLVATPTQRSMSDERLTPASRELQPAVYFPSEFPAWPAKMRATPIPRATTPAPYVDEADSSARELSRGREELLAVDRPGERPLPLVGLRHISFSGDRSDSAPSQLAGDASQTDPTSGDPVRSFTGATPIPVSEASTASEQQASDQLAALESRYSPYTGGTGYLDSHTGTEGFDRLQRFEAGMEASSVFGDSLRMTVITRPVLLESGIPVDTSNYHFGAGVRLPTTDQFAAGYGGELQIATKIFQASAGYSPVGFPVSHFLGSAAVEVANGAIVLRAYRESEKDTLLSYAGLTDPTTKLVWGGVVASGGTLKFAHGTGASGLYASLDGQELTGRNVISNTRIAAGAGAYFQVFSDMYGALKIGANFTAMHYERNERYFTYGQGGYFSPNAFILMNAPITWEGAPVHNVSYVVNGSLGVQTFQDGKAPPGSLIEGNGEQSVTGPSYDLHARLAYHLNQHWTIEGFFDANNARDYQNAAAGFGIRYAFRPMATEGGPSGLIDDKELRPLALP